MNRRSETNRIIRERKHEKRVNDRQQKKFRKLIASIERVMASEFEELDSYENGKLELARNIIKGITKNL